MKNLTDYITEKKYDTRIVLPPFNKQLILQALEAYKDNDDRKKNEGNGQPTVQQIDDTIELLKNAKVE